MHLYGQYCPVARAAEIFADRWTVLIILGRVPLVEAIRKGHVRLDGVPADVRGFGHWFTWSPMADTVRVALADRSTASHRGAKIKVPSKNSSAISMLA
jgi:hypothetical protein